ncbi:MAG: hypothetical protein JSS56_18545 [Proteobacteria bacterium]|nr:hypothetical protein [Pseudomonadota bacterium]
MATTGLFDSVPKDAFQFGYGTHFDARKVSEALRLKKEDVSHLASVSVKSVRYDDAIPEQVRERLAEIANTMNLVASTFDGDVAKAATWFLTRNPLLGDVSPRDMIRLGRYERLRRFIIDALRERDAQRYEPTLAA